jgi:ribosomal protein L44E
MRLDDINPSPLYDVTIPSTKAKIKFRPFVVKEERALLAAEASEDPVVMMNTLIQIVKNCTIPEQKSMTNFDFEYLFTMIRTKSVGEFSRLAFKCDDCEDSSINVEVDLRSTYVKFPIEKRDIKLSDDLAVTMRWLTVDEIVEIETKFDKIDHMFKAVCASIETVFYKDSVIECNKEDRASVENLVGRLNKKQYSILEEFVEGQPTTQIDVSYRCPKCRKPHEKTLSGLSNFFF